MADASSLPDVTELPLGDAGGGTFDAAASDAAPDAAAAPDAEVSCPGYADPNTQASCHACSGTSCQPNGCFGGYYCDLGTTHCVPKPSGC